ncbi:MAG: hypothetical protein AAF800_07190 [Planctomycetota bacterium]
MKLFCLFSLALSLAAVPLFSAAQSDDFNDNAVGPEWTLVRDDPATINVTETNGRVEATALAQSDPNVDAIYLSNGPSGFLLATDTNFTITLDYTFGGFDDSAAAVGDALGLAFGVGRDLEGTDSAAIGFGVSRQQVGPIVATGSALGAATRIDDAQSEAILQLFGPTSATLEVAYDATGDDLTLGLGGGASFTLEDTVRAVWGADDLLVSFGLRGSGFALTPSETFLDNFTIVSGRVIPTPEPATGGILGLVILVARRRRG